MSTREKYYHASSWDIRNSKIPSFPSCEHCHGRLPASSSLTLLLLVSSWVLHHFSHLVLCLHRDHPHHWYHHRNQRWESDQHQVPHPLPHRLPFVCLTSSWIPPWFSFFPLELYPWASCSLSHTFLLFLVLVRGVVLLRGVWSTKSRRPDVFIGWATTLEYRKFQS